MIDKRNCTILACKPFENDNVVLTFLEVYNHCLKRIFPTISKQLHQKQVNGRTTLGSFPCGSCDTNQVCKQLAVSGTAPLDCLPTLSCFGLYLFLYRFQHLPYMLGSSESQNSLP